MSDQGPSPSLVDALIASGASAASGNNDVVLSINSGASTKKGKGKSLSLPQLLETIADGDTKHRRLYAEFLEMMKGVRTMSFSKAWTDLEAALEAETTDTPERSSEYDFEAVVPPSWWSAVISLQSPICQALYWYRQRQHDYKHCKRLKRLFQTDPEGARVDLLEKWIDGTLKDWHIDILAPCHE